MPALPRFVRTDSFNDTCCDPAGTFGPRVNNPRNHMKYDTAAAETEDEAFEPYLGIAVADTWPMGKLLAIVQDGRPQTKITAGLKRWIDELWDDDEVPYDDTLKALTP